MIDASRGFGRHLTEGDGQLLAADPHIRQSVTDILTTRRGTRVQRPEYGSQLPDLVDRPINAVFFVDLYAETAHALQRWEPRVRLTRCRVTEVRVDGLTMELSLRSAGVDWTLEVAL